MNNIMFESKKDIDKIKDMVWHRVITRLPRIDVIPWEYHMNFRCHWNAFNNYMKKWDKIAAVIVNHCGPVAHFINISKDKFVENTVWHTWYYDEYYLLKIYDWDEFGSADNELFLLKQYLADIYNEIKPRYYKKATEELF